MKKLSVVLGMLLALSCVLCGCQSGDDPVSSQTAATRTTAGEIAVPVESGATAEETDPGPSGTAPSKTAAAPTKTGKVSPKTTATKSKATTKTTAVKKIPGQDEVEVKVDELGSAQFAKRSGIKGTVSVFIPWDVDARYERLKKEFEAAYPGTTVTYITSPWNTRTTKLANQIKAKKSPDCVSAYYPDFPSRVIKNLVQSLDAYLVEKDTLNLRVMKSVASYNGKTYALLRNAYPYAIYYNTAMFEDYGEKTPLEYYKEGKWNWNTFRTVAANMTDVQNGKVNTYGFGTDDETIFMLAKQTDLLTFKGGTPQLNITDPALTSSLDVFYKMCNTDKSVYAERWLNFNAFLESKIAMSYWRMDQDSIDRLKTAKVKWDIVPFPMADGVKQYYGTANGDGWSLGFDCKNPEGGMAFAEWEINDRAKINDTITFSADQKKRLSQIVGTISFVNCYGLEISFNNGFCNAMRNNGSMSAKLQEYKPEWETLIADVINGK